MLDSARHIGAGIVYPVSGSLFLRQRRRTPSIPAAGGHFADYDVSAVGAGDPGRSDQRQPKADPRTIVFVPQAAFKLPVRRREIIHHGPILPLTLRPS